MKRTLRYDIVRQKWRYVCRCEHCLRRAAMCRGYSRMLSFIIDRGAKA